MSIVEKIQTNQKLYLASLILLFLVSFVAPIAFAFTLGGLISRYVPEQSLIGTQKSQDAEQDRDSIFPEAINISGGSVITVKSSAAIDPRLGKDFLLSFWVQFRRLPSRDETFIILSKYDERSSSRKGYSFSVAGEEGDNFRPGVYWRDDTNNGTWFTFSEIKLVAKQWNLFVLSVRDNKLLGLHTATLSESEENGLQTELKLLGGYELSTKIIPQTKVDLEIGSLGSSRFRGKIGPIGIFNSGSLTESLDSVLKSLIQEPKEIPGFFSSEDVGLWLADGKEDRSEHRHEVSIPKSRKD